MQKIVDEIVRKGSYSVSVLITTKVLDNGITLTDSQIENIVVSAYNEYEFVQMLGRRRVTENETILLYVPKRGISYFQKRSEELFRKVDIARPLIENKNEEINSIILQNQIPWEIVNIFTYEDNNDRKFSWLTYYLFHQEYLELKNIIQAMNTDPEAFEKSICRWLKKDPDSDVQTIYGKTVEKEYQEIANKISALPVVISSDQFTEFTTSVNEIAKKDLSPRSNIVNKYLSQNKATRDYQFRSMSIAKSTFYCIEKNGKFPFILDNNITNVEKIKEILEENKGKATQEIFQKLFNADMPSSVIKDKESKKTSFITACVQEMKGFEKVAFRRQGNELTLYKEREK